MTGAVQSIGPYRIESELGRGAMGVVYKGLDSRNNLSVALKVIREEYFTEASDGEEARKRFAREALAIGTLVHPGIVSLYEFGEYQGAQFLAMEFVLGVSVGHLLSDGP